MDRHHEQAMVEGSGLWGWEMWGGVANQMSESMCCEMLEKP